MRAPRKDIRNLAIIAHVDHGKTTLLDGLLRQTGTFRVNQEVQERAMDSEDLERERGITIHAKSTAVEYNGVRIQLVDTPGHADFGGEVERVMGMVDAVLLLVDAVEGVMPQTRFVLGKALAQGLRPIVVVNKIDRPEQRAHEVVNEVFDLLVELGADDHQLDFPIVYTSAKQGTASLEADGPRKDLRPLLDLILEQAPPPEVDVDGPLQFQAVTLGWDEFVGRLVIGRVERGVPEARRHRRAHSRDGRAAVVPRDQAVRAAGARARRARGRDRRARSRSSPASTRSRSATRSARPTRSRRCRGSRSTRRRSACASR